MELKRFKKLTINSRQRVLIEPLWNWNKPLKADGDIPASSINRTFMELKPIKRTYMKYGIKVLIEPLWNWNNVKAVKFECKQKY